MIPLSLDMKCVVILFITDFIFFFCTHFCEAGDNGITTDFNNFENFKFLAEYMIINSNYNILTYFQKNVEHVRFTPLQSEKMEYYMKDNFNTYGLFYIYFSLLNERKVPLIINKKAYVDIMNEYAKIVLKEAKGFGIPEKSNSLMKYFIAELQKNKFISLNESELTI